MCSETGHWQRLGLHADGQQLVSFSACSGVSLLQVLFVMERDAGTGLEAYLVSDQDFSFVSESLRKTLAVILRTDMRSVPSQGFNNRWSLAVKRIWFEIRSSSMYL